ncbi:MAG: hypothetical protein M1816_003432 [Peltula sp. TS41687]|nr:MAG: hypothetical protein M1816_003432 [Peltula sp. TS41687]
MERGSFLRAHTPFERFLREPNDSVFFGDVSRSGRGSRTSSRSLRPPPLQATSVRSSGRHPAPPSPEDIDWETFQFKNEENVYNPDVDQMAEELQQFAMRNPGKPVPANYNSHLLHVIEAYQKLQRGLEAEKVARDADLQQWETERDIYEAEVKRLEDVIGSHAGLGGMVVARKSSLLRKIVPTKVLAPDDNDKEEEMDENGQKKLRKNTWKQDVRISRVFGKEGPMLLPDGTVPLFPEDAHFNELYHQHKGVDPSPTPSYEARQGVKYHFTTEGRDPEEDRKRMVLSGFLPSSSESGRGPDIPVDTLQEGNETAATTEGLAEAIAQSGCPAELFSETMLPQLERDRAMYETRSSTMHRSLLPEPLTPSRRRARTSAQETSEQLEQGDGSSENNHGRYRGFSFRAGDDAGGPSTARPLPQARVAETYGDPDDLPVDELRKAVRATLQRPVATIPRPVPTRPIPIPGAEVNPRYPALALLTEQRMRPRHISTEKPENIQGQDTPSSTRSTRAVTGQRISSESKKEVDFSAIAAARAFSGASNRKSSDSSQVHGKGPGPPSLGRASGAAASRQVALGATDPQGRMNRPAGVFPAVSTEAAEGMSVMESPYTPSKRKAVRQATAPEAEEEEEPTPSRPATRVKFTFR